MVSGVCFLGDAKQVDAAPSGMALSEIHQVVGAPREELPGFGRKETRLMTR